MTRREAGDFFDGEVVRTVAADCDVDADALAGALADHQASVASLPGVENLVYEWRKEYRDPLIERTEDAYYLQIPARVWSEFASHLDLSDEVADAVAEVHRRTVAARTDSPERPPEGGAYVALDRSQ